MAGVGTCGRVWRHVAGYGGRWQGVGAYGKGKGHVTRVGVYGRGRGGDMWQQVGVCGRGGSM